MNLRRAIESLRRDVAATRAAAGMDWSCERVEGDSFAESGWLLTPLGGGCSTFVVDHAPSAEAWVDHFRFLRDQQRTQSAARCRP